MPRPGRAALLLPALALLLAAGPTRAQAGAPLVWTDVPLAEALYDLADASGIELVFALRIVRDLRVSGSYAPGEGGEGALRRLLAGTGVRAERIRPGQFVLTAEPLAAQFGVEVAPEDLLGPLEVRVVDAETGAPLEGASVLLIDLDLGAAAEADGYAAVERLPTGRYAVRVSHVGYRAVRLDLDVFPASPRLPRTVRLSPEALVSPDAEVAAGPEATAPTPGLTDLAARQAAALRPLAAAGAARGDLAEALSWLPGLARAAGAGGAVGVRRTAPEGLRVLRDGVPVPEPWHALGLVSALQPEALGRVRLHRGSLPAGLGGATGGVLDVDTADPLAGRAGVAAADPLAARVVAAVPLGARAGVLVGARRSLPGEVLRTGLARAGAGVAVAPGGGHDDALGPRPALGFADAEAALALRLGPTARLDAGGWATETTLRAEPAGAAPVDLRRTSAAATVRARALVGQRAIVSGGVYAVRADARGDGGPDAGAALRETGARLGVAWLTSRFHELRAGAEGALRHLPGPPADARALDAAVFASDVWTPSEAWTLEPGVRAEAVGLDGGGAALSLSPRVFVRWAGERLLVRGGVSRQTQAVHGLRARVGPLAGVAERRRLASRALPVAVAWQVGAGAEWLPAPGLALSADVYARVSADVVEAAADGRAERLDGRAAGVELVAVAGEGAWTLALSTAATLARVRPEGGVSEGEPVWRASRDGRPLEASLLAEHRGPRLRLAARVDAEAGRTPAARRPAARAALSAAWTVPARGLRLEWTAQAAARLLPADAAEADAPDVLVDFRRPLSLVGLAVRW